MSLEPVDGVEVRACLAQPGEQRPESQVPLAGAQPHWVGRDFDGSCEDPGTDSALSPPGPPASDPWYPSEILARKSGVAVVTSLCAQRRERPLLMGRAAHWPEEASP